MQEMLAVSRLKVALEALVGSRLKVALEALVVSKLKVASRGICKELSVVVAVLVLQV